MTRRSFLRLSMASAGAALAPAASFGAGQGAIEPGPAALSPRAPASPTMPTAALGLGCMGMSEFYGPPNPGAVDRTLAAALDGGVSLLDTADMYGQGENERLVGRFLAGRRSRVVVATKFGFVRDGAAWRIDNRPAHVRAACEASLRRLGIECIDLFYAHRLNPAHPLDDTIGAMADLVKAGKVRAIGLSEVSAATIARAHALHPLGAVQSEYSLFTRGPERDILPACRQRGIAFVPYAPLARGLLGGQALAASRLGAGDFRAGLPRFQDANFATNAALVRRLAGFSAARGFTPAQVSLAWILARGPGLAPIPGARSVQHLSENLGATTLRLSPAEIDEVSAMFPLDVAAGRRYSDEEMGTVEL